MLACKLAGTHGYVCACFTLPHASSYTQLRNSYVTCAFRRPHACVIHIPHSDTRRHLCRRGLEDSVRLRSEAEAPFRSVRFLFFGFGVLNAAIATLTSVPQVWRALKADGSVNVGEASVDREVGFGVLNVATATLTCAFRCGGHERLMGL
eukprot:363689-Chlamydomonas_euryale.AAC.1